ncbi:MAG TPA: FtsX-like permease family protein [Gemmatimonadaceae bacterium]
MTGRAEGRAPLRTLLRLAWRESRTARRRLLLYMSSISLGVAALVAIDSFALNITRSVREQSRALVGGDVTFSARQGWTPAMDSLFNALPQRGIPVTRVTTFASMALAPRTGNTRLAQVRAVGEGYPLYGEITTTPPGQWERLQQGAYAIADPSLLVALDARAGDTVNIGYAQFALLGALASIPGDPGIAAAIGPRIYIPERYLAATQLLVLGSRADHDAFARVTTMNPRDLVQELDPVLDSNQVRARTIEQQESAITDDIDDLANFLGVVGIIALLLGGVGVASGVHAWVTRKIDTVAVLRCLGATTRQVMVIYITQAAAMGLVGAAIGAALGVGIQFLLPSVVQDVLPVDVRLRLEPQAIAMGMLLGLWIAMAFALRPLLALRHVSPLQALRRNEDPSPLRRWWRDPPRLVVNVLIALSVVGLAATRAEDPEEVFAFTGTVAGALVLLTLSASLLSVAARRLVRRGWPYVVRQGVANLYRPGNQTRSVVLSLGFGAFLVTTLYLVQNNLLAQFRQAELNARGNLVLFDVQDDQLAGVDSIVAANRQEVLERIPIITMRITAVNGRTTSELLNDSTRRGGAWSLRREYRSTYRDHLTGSEQLLAGTFHGTSRSPGPVYEVSLEQEVATSLRVGLGDTITWDVQGVPVETRVTSLREVNWQRFELNFFAVFEPAALQPAPKMFALLVRAENDTAVAQIQRDVVRRYPNVASVDISLVRRTVQQISDRATLAIRFLALFSLAMGVPVLFSAVSATRRDRIREGVLLKTLGATRRQISRILFSEYALLGVLGSLTGMVLSFGGAWVLLRVVFERSLEPATAAALVIAFAMLALTVTIGLLAGRDVFRETPMTALREL